MATSTTITGMTALATSPAVGDLLAIVDISDPSEAAAGTTKKITVANLFTAPAIASPTITNPSMSGVVLVTSGGITVTGNSTITGTLSASSSITTTVELVTPVLKSSGSATPLAFFQGATQVGVFGASNVLTLTNGIITGSTTLHQTSVALTNGAAAATGTLTNAPAAGNPTKWVPINDNGTTRYIPTW